MAVKTLIQQRWQSWLDRRLPRVKQVRLTQRNTFIFPSEEGFAFLFVALLIFIGGINYENSLMLGTAFFMGSLFLVAIVSTYFNVAGLTLTAVRSDSAFVDEMAFVEITLESTQIARYGLTFIHGDFRQSMNLAKNLPESLRFPFVSKQRGKGFPPRLLLESRYPLGFVRAWTWIAFDQYAVIYPKPIPCELQAGGEGETGRKQTSRKHRDEEYAGIREYREGDSLKSIAWKQLAKGGELMTYYREGSSLTTMQLEFDSVPAIAVEGKLGQLAWWVKELNRLNIQFSLKIPGNAIATGHGPQHLQQSLTSLALYGIT